MNPSGHTAYVTAHDDRVIDALRILDDIDVLESNINNDIFLGPIRDLSNHAFIKSYMKRGLPSRSKIDLMLERLIKNLDAPNISTLPINCFSEGVVNVTIKDKDTNTIIPDVKVIATHPSFGYFSGSTNQDGKHTVKVPVDQNSTLNIYQLSINASGYTPVLSNNNSFLQSSTQCTVIEGSINCFVSDFYPNNVTLLLEKSTDEFAAIEIKRVDITGEALPSLAMAQVDDLEKTIPKFSIFQ